MIGKLLVIINLFCFLKTKPGLLFVHIMSLSCGTEGPTCSTVGLLLRFIRRSGTEGGSVSRDGDRGDGREQEAGRTAGAEAVFCSLFAEHPSHIRGTYTSRYLHGKKRNQW